MLKITLILTILTFFSNPIHSQDCQKSFSRAKSLNYFSNIRTDKIKVSKSNWIEASKAKAEKALDYAYEAIKAPACSDNLDLINLIIELELKLGHNSQAKKFAYKTLERLYPDFYDLNKPVQVDLQFLCSFIEIAEFKKRNSFYIFYEKYDSFPDRQRRLKNMYYRSYIQATEKNANALLKEFKPIFAIRYLENSMILLDDTCPLCNNESIEVYKVLATILKKYYTLEELIQKYEEAEILVDETILEPKDIITDPRSKYYIQLDWFKLYLANDYSMIRDRVRIKFPSDPEKEKENSKFIQFLRSLQ